MTAPIFFTLSKIKIKVDFCIFLLYNYIAGKGTYAVYL